ncbi:caspase family protein, partial [Bradyrhizobium japonicum]|nr:caspase family protein [Bradyrhizobium japonicum]
MTFGFYFFAFSTLHAETRAALVIGNSAYQSVPFLPNPVNDASDVSAVLKKLGFTVKSLTNARFDDVRRALIEFDQMAAGADIAFIYFAGHGMEIDGQNWLIPIDAQLLSDRSVSNEAIGLQSLTKAVSGANSLGLVILDACRINPFLAKMQVTNPHRAVSRGFSRVEPAKRVLVAYSALAGTTANDGSGRNSPYTEALLRNIATPGLEVRKLFARLRDQVMSETRNEQQPVTYETLPEKDIFFVPPVSDSIQAMKADDAFWNAIKDSKVTAVFEEFLRAYPTSSHAGAARARLGELNGPKVTLASPPPATTTPITTLQPSAIEQKPALSNGSDRVVARVNGSEIRRSDVAVAKEELGPSLDNMDPATKDENVLSFLIDMKIVAKSADDEKIADNDDFKKRFAFTRNRLLMDSLLAAKGKAAITDEAMKKVYDDAAKQISGEQEVHARHILVETESEAKAIKAELNNGTNFAELAKKRSKDPGASAGGDLGFFTQEQMVPEFSAVAFKLQPGQISDPVRTQFGWHIIKVEEKRNRKAPDFDQVKAQIESYVTRKAQADYVAKLRENARIERLDVPSDGSDRVVARVNGSEIRRSDVAVAKEELGPSLDKMDPATKDENVLSFLIDMKIVAKSADDEKIADNDDFKKRFAFTRNRLLMDSLLAAKGKAAITDEAMKKVYDDAAKQISGEQEVHARHILVETESEAKAIKAELNNGT